MKKTRIAVWLWSVALAAIVAGLFAPTMIARASAELQLQSSRCPIPTQGDVLS